MLVAFHMETNGETPIRTIFQRQHSRRSLENYYVIDMDSIETLHVNLMHYENAPLLNKEALIINEDESGNGPAPFLV